MTFTDGPDGSTDQALRIEAGQYTNLKTSVQANQSFTLSMWMRLNSSGVPPERACILRVVTNSEITEQASTLSLDIVHVGTGSSYFVAMVENLSVVSEISADPYVSGWHMVSITYDKTTEMLEMYIDGVSIVLVEKTLSTDNMEIQMPGNDILGYTRTSPMDIFDLSIWDELHTIEELNTYQAAVISDPDSVLPPEEA